MGFRPRTLENLVMNPDFWRGKRVLLTGHTGFKGAWLSLWLDAMGAEVVGYALAPPEEDHIFVAAEVGNCVTSITDDIRNLAALKSTFVTHRPEIVLHLAAQALVRESYRRPVDTYATNVIGTVNVLEAVRSSQHVRVVIIVTSDKCYENDGSNIAFRESAPMGGHDPYSSSKGCAELVTAAYRASFLSDAGIGVATARAGNVIGGGDSATDRLLPDAIRALRQSETLVVRNPTSVRPWQHVLEPLSGYLTLAEALWNDPLRFSEGWNFGPPLEDAKTVQWVTERLFQLWGVSQSWRIDQAAQVHEASYLMLESEKARTLLSWQPRWSLERALLSIVEWYRARDQHHSMRLTTLNQIASFVSAT
jgi:CDP-glucose 4,6-dehydratase